MNFFIKINKIELELFISDLFYLPPPCCPLLIKYGQNNQNSEIIGNIK